MREFVLWALPKGKTNRLYEQPITCTTDKNRLSAIRQMAEKDGWHGFRIQVDDGSPPDFSSPSLLNL